MELPDVLQELGYTKSWLDLGIVSEDLARQQYAEYCTSDDQHQEHYRHKAFSLFLGRTPSVSDELVDDIFLLEDDGPDGHDLAAQRAIDLIISRKLSDEQHFKLVERHPEVLEPPIRKLYLRESLSRKIRATGLDANFQEIQLFRDSGIQWAILDRPDLSKSHVEWLATAGSNKVIRNRAAELLRSRRFR